MTIKNCNSLYNTRKTSLVKNGYHRIIGGYRLKILRQKRISKENHGLIHCGWHQKNVFSELKKSTMNNMWKEVPSYLWLNFSLFTSVKKLEWWKLTKILLEIHSKATFVKIEPYLQRVQTFSDKAPLSPLLLVMLSVMIILQGQPAKSFIWKKYPNT